MLFQIFNLCPISSETKAKSVKASNMAPSTEIVAVEDTPREEAPSTSVIAELSTSPTPLKDHTGGAPKGSEVSALSPPPSTPHRAQECLAFAVTGL